MSDPSVRLRAAIEKDNYFIVVRLLRRFPDLIDNIDPTNGWTNLHYAAFHDRYEISDFLLGLIVKRDRARTNGRPANGSPSSYTQITNEDEIKLNFDKDTVLHSACRGNSRKTLKLLLSFFNVCIDQRGNQGHTPSHVCCIKDHPECLQVLLQSEAYPNLIDDVGNTPLHLALQYGYLRCAELLVRYNADDTMVNNDGWTPLDLVNDFDTKNRYLVIKQRLKETAEGDAFGATTGTNPIPTGPGAAAGAGAGTSRTSSSSHGGSLGSYSSALYSAGVSMGKSHSGSSFRATKISLPSVRKYSVSSAISDDSLDNELGRSSPASSIRSDVSLERRLPRKPPPGTATTGTATIGTSSSIGDTSFAVSTTSVGSLDTQTASSSSYTPSATPTTTGKGSPSPRGPMATRTLRNRSDSQSSEPSPTKSGNSTISSSSSKRLSRSRIYNTSTSLNNEYDAAASKLSDFKQKNQDRLKLDTRLGNILNRSQESLSLDTPDYSPTDKKSRILSVPIRRVR